LSPARKIASIVARTSFARRALEEQADLSLFAARPSVRVMFGIFLIGLSYLIGWPAVGLFGILSIYFKEPLIVIIGGPAVYGLSHLVFVAGAYLAGAEYARTFIRWATRKALERILGGDEV
jgi:hypothetical protein